MMNSSLFYIFFKLCNSTVRYGVDKRRIPIGSGSKINYLGTGSLRTHKGIIHKSRSYKGCSTVLASIAMEQIFFSPGNKASRPIHLAPIHLYASELAIAD